MAKKLITAPTVEPVTRAEMLSKFGIQSGDVLDADLDLVIAAARRWAEEFTGRAFISQTWEIRLDAFPNEIELARPPIVSITSLKYLDADGVEQTLDPLDYSLDDFTQPGWVFPAYGKAWPTTRAEANAVRLRFVAGYGAAGANVPEPIRQAIVLIAGQSLRGQSGNEANLYPASVPNAAKELLQGYVMMSF